MNTRSIRSVSGHSRIDGVVAGVRGQRSLPTRELGVVDPFVMLDHIGPQTLAPDFSVNGTMHPHRGFETLTMMFEGVMHHIDSAGFEEKLASGSTQNMVAGSGIQHGGSMEADPDSHVFHEVQLWVNMPAANKMDPPTISSVHTGDTPFVGRGHYVIEVITGTIDGNTSPLTTTSRPPSPASAPPKPAPSPSPVSTPRGTPPSTCCAAASRPVAAASRHTKPLCSTTMAATSS